MAADPIVRGTEPFWDEPSIPQTSGELADNIEGISKRSDNPWDFVVIKGKPTPGIASVVGRKCHRVDVKESPGTDGATLTHLGYEPAEIDITIRVWTAIQWAYWQSVMLPLIQPRPGKGIPTPAQMYHPALAAMGISKLYVVEIGLPRDVQPRGVKEIIIRCQEWRPTAKKDVTFTPKQSTDYTTLPRAIGGPSPSASKTGVPQASSFGNTTAAPPPSQTKAGP